MKEGFLLMLAVAANCNGLGERDMKKSMGGKLAKAEVRMQAIIAETGGPSIQSRVRFYACASSGCRIINGFVVIKDIVAIDTKASRHGVPVDPQEWPVGRYMVCEGKLPYPPVSIVVEGNLGYTVVQIRASDGELMSHGKF